MFVLINKLTAKPGKRREVVDILLESGKAFDNNPDCKLYLVSEDVGNENLIWVQDIWLNETAHTSAMQDEEMQSYVRQSIPLLEGTPEQTKIIPVGGKVS